MTFQFVTFGGARCAEHRCPSGLVGTVGVLAHRAASNESRVFPGVPRAEGVRR
jgi:hypothetical protein